MTQPEVSSGKLPWLRAALWFGIVYGLLEAILLQYFLATAPLRSWLRQGWVDWNILWIAPLVDVALFSVVGLATALVCRALRRELAGRVILSVYVFVTVAGLLMLPARLNRWAVFVLALGVTRVFWAWVAPREATAWRFIRVSTKPICASVLLLAGGFIGSDYYRARAGQHRSTDSASRRNVLLIVADALRADRMSLYGYARPTTPNLSALAANSLVFERAISTSSWTLPAHASLFTGLYPYQHGAGDRELDATHPTLAELLRAHGYRTGGFVANTVFGKRDTGLARGFQHYEDVFGSPLDAIARTVYGRRILARLLPAIGYHDWPGRKSAADINRQLLRWLDRTPHQPFFAFLNYMDLHHPYFPPRDAATRYFGSAREAMNSKPIDQDSFDPRTLRAEQLQMESDAYDSVMTYVDAHIQNLLNELHKRGLLENTLVVITSDHGEAFNEHGLFGHGASLYRQRLHVPLMVHDGNKFSPGTRSDRIVDLADVPATILSLLGHPVKLPGRVITTAPPLSRDDWSEVAFSELSANPLHGPNAPNRTGWLKSLVTRRWHFIQHQDGSVQLFDWEKDREEVNDLAGSPEHHGVVAEFRALMAQRIQGATVDARVKAESGAAGSGN